MFVLSGVLYTRKKRGGETANRLIKECFTLYNGDTVAQSVERATLGEEVPSLIPAVAARSLLVGSASV